MATEYPRPLELNVDDIQINEAHDQYANAVMAVDYYHRQAVLMTPEEQATYLRMIDKSDFLTSPSNQNTPSNNKLWKYLVTQRNPYCRAHFVMLASIYGINRLTHLRGIVEGAGDEFEISDLSEHYNHYYFPTPLQTTQESVSAAVAPNHSTSIHTSLSSPASVFLSTAPPVDDNEPLTQPPTANRARDPFLPPSPSAITIDSSPERQSRSPTYSPRLESIDEVAELKAKIKTLEEEKANLVRVVYDQNIAYEQLQQQFSDHLRSCNHN
ncbi:hypothetical protein TrVFT333_001485 [Trichoderma virens FT-333]|nr:hypothetical protein TrVFT333_001485 [Trichoderma virens FT-333]